MERAEHYRDGAKAAVETWDLDVGYRLEQPPGTVAEERDLTETERERLEHEELPTAEERLAALADIRSQVEGANNTAQMREAVLALIDVLTGRA